MLRDLNTTADDVGKIKTLVVAVIGYQAALAEVKAVKEDLCVMRASNQVILTQLQSASAKLAKLKNVAKSPKVQRVEDGAFMESCKAL